MTVTIDSRIERRLLVSWRADPEAVVPIVPPPFRPRLIRGSAVVGICFLRLGQLRPRPLPAWLGLRSESAAHRIAIEWDTPLGVQPGVYVLDRVTSSRAAVLAGGRLFPGVHFRARFDVHETDDQIDVAVTTASGHHDAAVSVRPATTLASQAFTDLAELSAFFRDAPVGWSPTRRPGAVEPVALLPGTWAIGAASIDHVRSAFFEDRRRFPPGSIEPDSAALMGNIPASWRRPARPFGRSR